MTAQTGAGIEGLEAVGLGLGSVDDLPDVDAHLVAQNGQLVDKADVDVAVGVLQDLLHLRHGGGGHGVHIALENGAVDHRDHLGGVVTDGAHHLGGVAGLVHQIARIHALGGEAQIEVLTALETAALLQNGLEQLLGGAGIGGGLQHHHGAGLEILGDLDGGVLHIADVRLLVGIQRGGDADGDKVHIADPGEIGGSAEHTALHQLCQLVVHHIADVVLTGVDQIHLFLLHVKTDGLEAVACLVHCQRQTHIAQTAHAHGQGLILNFLNQFFLHRHINRSPLQCCFHSSDNSCRRRRR